MPIIAGAASAASSSASWLPQPAALGKHILIAGIDGGNQASIRLHAQMGFAEVARMPEVGRKFGRWLDLVFMQRILDRPGAERPD